MILRNLIPAIVAWLLCHGKRKIMPKPRPKKDWIHCPGKEQSLPEPLAHMLDELDTKL